MQGKHFDANTLFEQFTRLPEEQGAELEEAASVLARTTQSLIDVLHDAIRTVQRGSANFAITGLFFWLVDEVTTVQFLACRGHATLAYPHLRSMMEINDKIELFTKKPEHADVWVPGMSGQSGSS